MKVRMNVVPSASVLKTMRMPMFPAVLALVGSILLSGAPASAEEPEDTEMRGTVLIDEPVVPPVQIEAAAEQASPSVRGLFPNLRYVEFDMPVDRSTPLMLAEAETRVVAALRTLLQDMRGTVARPARVSAQELDTIVAYYARRDFKPLWVGMQGWTPAGASLIARIERAEDDGLERLDYPLRGLERDPASRAQAEITTTLAAFSYARDARGARLSPIQLSKLMTAKPVLPTVEIVMTAIEAATDTGAALQAFNPQHQGYIGLRRKLIEMRETTGSLPVTRTSVPQDGAKQTPAQTATVSAGELIANMERWRWLPQDLGARRIVVNIPEYTMRLYRDDKVYHEARVVVGKTTSQTPVFSELMEYVVVNPSWGVPSSILKKEFLPKLAADPDYAAKHGYQVIRSGDRIVGIRQPPGERNALGFIKFMFPNEHAVYLHDTPQRALFAKEERAFSHGCVRVDQPFALANALLGEMGYDEARLRGMIGKGERTIHLTEKLPVHLTYFTISVDETGVLRRFSDIYGHDGKVRTALARGPNRVAGLR